MTSKEIKIVNKSGLHARPASEFTRQAMHYQSEITLKNLTTGRVGNAKSIISVLEMGLVRGTTLQIFAQGDDETEAVEALTRLVESGFGMEEER